MVIEARREGMKKENSNILSPFSNKSTPLNNKNPNKFKETNSILREPQKHTNNPSTPNTNTPQRLPNQYTNNSTIVNNMLTGDNSINNATANLNVAIADTGEHIEKSDDTNTAFANMINWYNDNCKPTYHFNNLTCKVSREITVMLSRLHKVFNIVDGGADTHVVGNIWKPLQPIDSHTPRADVVGFDSNAAR